MGNDLTADPETMLTFFQENPLLFYFTVSKIHR